MIREPADEPPSRLSPDRLQAVRLRAEAVAAAMRQRQAGPAPSVPTPAADPDRWTVSIPPDYFARELYLGTRAPAAANGRKRHYLAVAFMATLGVLLPDFLPPARIQDPVVPQMAMPAVTGIPDQKLSAALREPAQLAPMVDQKIKAATDPVEIPPVAAPLEKTTPEVPTPEKPIPVKGEAAKKEPVKKEAVKVAKPGILVPSPDAMKPKSFEPTTAPATALPKYTPPATQPAIPKPKPFQPSWP